MTKKLHTIYRIVFRNSDTEIDFLSFYNIFELDIIGGLGRLKMVNDKDPRGLIDTTKGLYHVYDNIYSGINRCSGRDSLKYLEVANKIIK